MADMYQWPMASMAKYQWPMAPGRALLRIPGESAREREREKTPHSIGLIHQTVRLWRACALRGGRDHSDLATHSRDSRVVGRWPPPPGAVTSLKMRTAPQSLPARGAMDASLLHAATEV